MDFLRRFGAVCGALCGLLIAIPGGIEAVTGETAATSFALGLSPALAPPLLVALYLTQNHHNTLSRTGYALNALGLGLFGGAGFTLNMALFYLDDDALADLMRGPTRVALLGSALVFVAGTSLYAVAMYRARVFPRVAVILYGAAFSAFALAAPLPDTLVTNALHVTVGATLCWLARETWPPRPADPIIARRQVEDGEGRVAVE